MDIKPIETVYNGYRFRSRLEARWAVFFDAIGAEWEYEPEGFQLPDGTKYLPDFRLHNVKGRGANDIWVEIKGTLSDKDLHKIVDFSYGSNELNEWGIGEIENPIIVFGKIPDSRWNEPCWEDTMIEYYGKWTRAKVYQEGWWSFDYSTDNNDVFYNLIYSEGDWYWTEPKMAKGGGLVLDYPDNPYDFVDKNGTAKAFLKARQARFEHGETPKGGK